MCIRTSTRQRGVTLIELVVFIIIVGVALAGVLSSLNVSVKSSADPLQPKQALVIAEGALEGMLLKDYADVVTPSPASSTPLTGYTATVAVDGSHTIGGIAAKRILVTVSTPSGTDYTLSGYRMSY